MTAGPVDNFAALDAPAVTVRLFHPRPELGLFSPPCSGEELAVPVDPGVAVGGRFYAAAPEAPTILFFHGNGEIVADYEELGPIYARVGLNFLPVDYRGYGRSTGAPTVSAMMRDCHTILDFARDWLSRRGFSGPLMVMGRSLGSASALELAHRRQDGVDGLIIESGFAYVVPLLRLIGVDLETLGGEVEAGFRHPEKMGQWTKPLLIIHGEYDRVIPCAEGEALFNASPSKHKTFLKVAQAGHNDLLAVGFQAYMDAIARLGALLLVRQETVIQTQPGGPHGH
jgi:pimeloyl-ACP methyl ester carboxylesterase